MFFGAILAESQPTSILVDCARMFENRTFDFFKKPEAIRKTFRAFIPVYLTFRRELKKRNDVMNLLSQQLNNSRFACEYLETFYFRKSVLRFISWNNSLEKQIYNSLCLGSLAVERSDEFVDFVHACVDDINNHSRAFNLYDKFFT
jgi:hypothetical protein